MHLTNNTVQPFFHAFQLTVSTIYQINHLTSFCVHSLIRCNSQVSASSHNVIATLTYQWHRLHEMLCNISWLQLSSPLPPPPPPPPPLPNMGTRTT